jgi:hypothetical protein
MAESREYKYKINHYIGLLPRHITIGSIERLLADEHGISRDTFYRDRNVAPDDDFSIPTERLDIYAGLLNITPDELKNYEIKVKPLVDRKLSDFDKSILKKTGLGK